MGLLDNYKMSDEEKENRLLVQNNIFEGIICRVVLPEKQLKTSSKSGTTKGLATLGFGFIGLAATSGVSQNEENRMINTIFQIVEKGIVFKNGNIDGSDLRIPFEEIIDMNVGFSQNGDIVGLITLIENKRIFIQIDENKTNQELLFNHIAKFVNQKACGIKYEEPGWGLKSQKTSSDSELLDNLERLNKLYADGVLNDNEFQEFKERILKESSEIGQEEEVVYCEECGAALEDGDSFCQECGTKIIK